MPTYDYRCESCNNTFEYFQNMSDEPLNKCPDCNRKVRRLVSGGTGLIFKGSGFYLTDYKDDGPKEDKKVKETKKTDDKLEKKEKTTTTAKTEK